jgi:CRP-like cAMP-binding protein
MEAIAAHPVAELLDCPPETGNLLTGAAQCLDFHSGDVVFQQNGDCRGLYLVLSGQFVRKAERLKARVTLGTARAGELVELAASLANSRHTYTLRALTPGTLLLLPTGALDQALDSYPAMRMRLLEELAREVSRAYLACRMDRKARMRRDSNGRPVK